MSESARRWRTLEELYQAALEHEPSARAAFLNDACPDESIRREVESLLDARGAGDELLERPALRYAAQPLEPGAMLAQYRIEQRIGAGETAQCHLLFPTLGMLHKLWGGPPGPRVRRGRSSPNRIRVVPAGRGRRGRRPRTWGSAPQFLQIVQSGPK